jgi:hypothetical protein
MPDLFPNAKNSIFSLVLVGTLNRIRLALGSRSNLHTRYILG